MGASAGTTDEEVNEVFDRLLAARKESKIDDPTAWICEALRAKRHDDEEEKSSELDREDLPGGKIDDHIVPDIDTKDKEDMFEVEDTEDVDYTEDVSKV